MSSFDNEIKPQRPYVGVILLLIRDDKLLLQQRSTDDELKYLYAPIAGKVDQFESPSDAVIREAFEEAGIGINPEDITLSCTVHWANRSYKNESIDVIEFYYTASQFTGTPRVMEPDKAVSVDWYDLDNLPQTMVTSINPILAAIRNGQHYLEWDGDK